MEISKESNERDADIMLRRKILLWVSRMFALAWSVTFKIQDSFISRNSGFEAFHILDRILIHDCFQSEAH